MTEPRFYNKDGSLTAYAFACGYVQTFAYDSADGYYHTAEDAVSLLKPSPGGSVWDVQIRRDGKTDWSQFDTLTEARRYWSKVRTAIRKGLPTPEAF